jgi:two-component system, cell cycle sensor histidine kinase and response regulator CckA
LADDNTLEETVALLEAALESVHDGVLVADLGCRVVRYNQRLLNMFGLTAELLERSGVDGILPVLPEQLEDAAALFERSNAIRAQPEREAFDVLRLKDGRIVERYVAPQRIGSTIVGTVASFRDVSDGARADEAFEPHRLLLEKAQEIAHVGSWVGELDGSDRLVWSAETHRIFGVPSGQFDGTAAGFFAFVHPDDREAVRAAGMAAQASGVPYEIVHRIVRPDGTTRWVYELADILKDANGRPVRMVGTVQDITDRRQLEEQLRQSQRMETIGRLAGGIAHDFNNALTAIAGYAELALGQLEDGHQARVDVEEIRRGAERAGSVTRQLLAFSRKQLLEPRVFSLNDTVSSIGRLLSHLLGTGIEVHSRLGSSIPPVLGDPGQIEQAIINLAVNARDAMATGGRLVLETLVEQVDDLSARARLPMPAGRYVVLRVSDTGHGMSQETRSRVFEPFFTTKEIGRGTGLGLSMVYGTMKQIGGFIFVDSEAGRGSTFSLYFPPAAGVPAAASATTSATDVPKRRTLLIVEDEPAVRNLVASALRNDGYELLLAGSAEEALEIAAAHESEIDLLLTDAMMPGRSGVELARELVARRPDLPVILMSGYTEESLPVGNLDQPISLLQKPFTPRELRRRIQEVLNR